MRMSLSGMALIALLVLLCKTPYPTSLITGFTLLLPLPFHRKRLTNLIHSLIVCAIYYYAWIQWIPYFRSYKLRQELIDLGGGAEAHHISKVPLAELEEWDATHDAVGRFLGNATTTEYSGEKSADGSLDVKSKDLSTLKTVEV